MATNPRIPDRPELPTLRSEKKRTDSAKLVPLGILIAAVLLVALIIWMPRAPRGTTGPRDAAVPPQPTGNQVQVTNVHLSPAPVGQSMYVYATIFNAGNTAINGLRMNVAFNDQGGTQLPPSSGIAEDATGKNLVDNPIPPKGTRDIRIPVQDVPQNWNHQVPGLKIDTVTAQGAK
jgi:hypothetical protein